MQIECKSHTKMLGEQHKKMLFGKQGLKNSFVRSSTLSINAILYNKIIIRYLRVFFELLKLHNKYIFFKHYFVFQNPNTYLNTVMCSVALLFFTTPPGNPML